MDLHLKQCRNQHESEQQHSTKMPRLLLPEPHQQQQSPASVLPLFVSEPNSKVSTLLSASSDSALDSTTTTTFPPVGSYFSIAQWQELELQTLIFRYMLAGAAVPPELLQPIKKSLLHSPICFLNQPLQHVHPALLQSSYWGRAAMDPEPDRCRRTDGKKWRCSREAVAGQKYCERHMHRGRNRSRKPVELPMASSATGGSLVSTSSSYGRSYGIKNDSKSLLENQDHVNGDGKSGGRIPRPFFNDWLRSSQDPDNGDSNAGMINSATHLSMSKPGSTSSDVSLKLFTGHAETKKW